MVLLIIATKFEGLTAKQKLIPIPPSLRVDAVGLPDRLKTDETAPHPEPSSTPVTETPPEVPETVTTPSTPVKNTHNAVTQKAEAKKTKSKQNTKNKALTALEKIKALQKIQNSVEKGNRVSHGTSLSPEAKESLSHQYYDLLRDKIQDNWTLPQYLLLKNLSAQVTIRVNSQGKILALQFDRSSGNPQFDQAVRRALTESIPLPAPPKDLLTTVALSGISLGFPL
jgi:colicin import membrane protein